MEKSSLILDKTLIEKELRKVSPKRPSELRKKLLTIGDVKSLTADDDSTNVEAAKDYYFIHLSFQELFAAPYLINALQNPKLAPDVINGLLAALGDEHNNVRSCAAQALGKMDDSAATTDVVRGLLAALGDEH
ncbi:unnamed protein product [Didymodactylos carnosus]|uniref:HEAT repeat domain-containing protein n=1 Tax=Didymodactylos carnosus TaxID=1234261 RepID=A0A816E3M3_9BILA|nr:unnamed protein product [Didymodactylos carnosus]CAF1642447.1 unnamed protein product [Didymodactylos carnosus]CAF4068138.1 unnamed protein product [Didymodactylos carnosus]CAF4556180.1 unnamed protein product [Didymodactylos carnosus]